MVPSIKVVLKTMKIGIKNVITNKKQRTMKKLMYFASFVVMALMSVSCSNEEIDNVAPPTNERVAYSAVMQFTGSKPSYDDEGITRGATDSWADGSKVYLQLLVGTERVDGVATYNSSNQEWTVEYFGALTATNDGKCEAYYFENAGAADYKSVTLTSASAIFADKSATYSFEDNTLKVTANLKPMTGRIRMKGDANQTFYVDGVSSYMKYSITENSFSSEKKVITGTTAKGGYSSYIYGFFGDEDNKEIIFDDKENNLGYTKVLGANALAVGKSGYLNIPTLNNRSGWSLLAEKEFNVGSVSFKMIRVICGTYMMWNQYSVTLSRNYFMGETEVTQALWNAVMNSNPSSIKGDNLPVNNVSWNDCISFIEKLNAKTGGNFRMPTEAEWEFAAKGANKSSGYKYCGSNTVDEVAWYSSNSSSTIHEVKSKKPNEIQIYDMSGNVNEFCQDGRHDLFAGTDPVGGLNDSYKIYRGGAYSDGESYQRICNYRGNYYSSSTSNTMGLRLASY